MGQNWLASIAASSARPNSAARGRHRALRQLVEQGERTREHRDRTEAHQRDRARQAVDRSGTHRAVVGGVDHPQQLVAQCHVAEHLVGQCTQMGRFRSRNALDAADGIAQRREIGMLLHALHQLLQARLARGGSLLPRPWARADQPTARSARQRPRPLSEPATVRVPSTMSIDRFSSADPTRSRPIGVLRSRCSTDLRGNGGAKPPSQASVSIVVADHEDMPQVALTRECA